VIPVIGSDLMVCNSAAFERTATFRLRQSPLTAGNYQAREALLRGCRNGCPRAEWR
jgi:hypothetical protein